MILVEYIPPNWPPNPILIIKAPIVDRREVDQPQKIESFIFIPAEAEGGRRSPETLKPCSRGLHNKNMVWGI